MTKSKFTKQTYLFWMINHNVSLALYLLESIFYQLFDKIEETIYVKTGKGTRGEYKLGKIKQSIAKEGGLKTLDIFACARRYLEVLGWSGDALDEALVYFHPATLKHFYLGYFSIKCSYYYTHIHDGESFMLALTEVELVTPERSIQMFGKETHDKMMKMSIKELLIFLMRYKRQNNCYPSCFARS